MLLINSLLLSALSVAPSLGSTPQVPLPAQAPSLESRWGVELQGVRRSAAGYMLDFRFTVSDPIKAAPLFDRGTQPYLIDEANGAKFLVPSPPKIGPLRTSDPPKLGRRYFIFFGNPGKFIKPGEKVTIVIGDFRAEHLVVR